MMNPLTLGAGEHPTRPHLIADLWFAWESPQHSVEVVLITVNGTIAGAFPRSVDNGERIPIHRKFLHEHGTMTWCLRIAAAATALQGLRVWVELRDVRGRCLSTPLCDVTTIPPHRVHTMQTDVQAPPEMES